VDAYRQFHTREAGFTFPTWDPHLRLDYLFVPQPDIARVLTCEVVRGTDVTTASDHLPIVADFDV
jgi:exodeoxyribonuclease-3